MMLRQWSRRSVSSTLRRSLQQRRSVIKSTNIGGGRATVSTIANNSSWIHQRSLGNDADENFFRLPTTAARVFSSAAEEYHPEPRPFKKLMAANRGEIATRILRAGTELGCSTVGIYSHEDRFTQHRYKADQAFQLSSDKSPVAAYLDIPTIVELCVQNGVEAVHPGYGLLSENANFAKSLEEAGVKFVGPTVDNLNTFGDKTSAKELAIKANVPIITGSDSTFSTPSEAKEWIEDPNNPITYPVIVKAAMGGGGRGIRIVPTADDLESMFRLASNEALNAFGDGRCFVEKYVDQPRHIEVQCLGDGTGNVIHLFDRDCSVQRRHQKVIETAPATGLSRETRQKIFDDAVRMLSLNKYRNAGTVEFLVDKDGNHFFMEVNPRVQVEHTITEEITGIDIVQSQILIASGKTLPEIGLTQDSIPEPTMYAMQCRVTTENPAHDFRPDTGTIDVFLLVGDTYSCKYDQWRDDICTRNDSTYPKEETQDRPWIE